MHRGSSRVSSVPFSDGGTPYVVRDTVPFPDVDHILSKCMAANFPHFTPITAPSKKFCGRIHFILLDKHFLSKNFANESKNFIFSLLCHYLLQVCTIRRDARKENTAIFCTCSGIPVEPFPEPIVISLASLPLLLLLPPHDAAHGLEPAIVHVQWISLSKDTLQ